MVVEAAFEVLDVMLEVVGLLVLEVLLATVVDLIEVELPVDVPLETLKIACARRSVNINPNV